MMLNKKALIIGETQVCVQCAKYLLGNNWQIIGFISDDAEVRNWAFAQSLAVFGTDEMEQINEAGFYLFSIINPYLISPAFLLHHQVKLALNYHDSLLPRYAGINSTTWAIIQNEKEHGVSFHQIESGIDTGAIAGQVVIPIEEGETALSLNLKCSEQFLKLFQKVIQQIENDSLTFFHQDLNFRTYYGFNQIPHNYAILDITTDFALNERLVRALTFGNYDNPVATIKVWQDNRFYIVENIEFLTNASVTVHEVKNIYGHPDKFPVNNCYTLSQCKLSREELTFLSQVRAREPKYKKKLKALFSDASMGFMSARELDLKTLEPYFSKSLNVHYINIEDLVSIIYIALARFFYHEQMVSLYFDDTNLTTYLRQLVDQRNFMFVDKKLVFDRSLADIQAYIKPVIENFYTVTKDFSYRYRLNWLTDIAIVIGCVECVDRHAMKIIICDDQLQIQGGLNNKISIDGLIESLDCLLSQWSENKFIGYNLKAMHLLNDSQYEQGQEFFPDYTNKTIHQWFEKQVEKTLDRTAIVCAETRLTYRELNSRSNQLAHYLRDNYNIQPDDFVAIFLDRSEQWIIAILAILKAGAAYVPLEPGYPDNRIAHILGDTQAKAVITLRCYYDRAERNCKNILIIDDDQLKKSLIKKSGFNPMPSADSDHLAYIIYTSGTTGKPKGVLQPHYNVIRLFTATNDWYQFNHQDIWTLFHSYVFDFSVWEIWGALLYGGTLVIPTREEIKDLNAFYQLCYKEKVTVLNQTPKAFYQFIDIALKNTAELKLINLRYVIFGGDKLNYSNLIPWVEQYGYNNPRLINMYGITETTVHVTYKMIEKKDIDERGSYIGFAIPDQKLYVLDQQLEPLPVGAIGELYVGGAGLARGYLNQPELTRSKFISNPFQTEKERLNNQNSRLYKTGDLVRRLPDGQLEYIGRNDSQVKIRGYRIELSEIEKVLVSYPAIRQAVVLAKGQAGSEHAHQYLAAYYIAEKPLDHLAIHRYLSEHLPDYMNPNIFIHLEKLPLTINGKVDIKALPDPRFERHQAYVPPVNEKENFICNSFSQVLGIKTIGMNDDFFGLGGDSLGAIRLTSILQSCFAIKVADVFKLRTPNNIAETILFGEDMLEKTLKKVKEIYKSQAYEKPIVSEEFKKKLEDYLNSNCNLKIDCTLQKGIKNILLTGVTGYLGCNILNQLLSLTDYSVFLLIRAETQQEAVFRLRKKYQFYFDQPLDDVINKRIFIIRSDIEQPMLGLTLEEYHSLTAKVDSVIHCAALVKHYGEESQFYSANVQATLYLLDFTQLTNLKDFHYISTLSVFNFELALCNQGLFYTENDMPENVEKSHNIYNRTKLQGEREVIKARLKGIKTNVYRIGNLAFISENFRPQENVDDNAFINWLRCFFELECVPKEIRLIEVSQVDLTAQAIVKIFDKQTLVNNTYHLFNPCFVNLIEVFENNPAFSIETLSMENFIDRILVYLKGKNDHELILRFLLRQGWLDGKSVQNMTAANMLQNRTQYILEKLGFKWVPVTSRMFNKYINLLEGLNEYVEKKVADIEVL